MLRRTGRIVLVGLALIAGGGTALVLTMGPTSRTAQPYSGHRTFISTAAALCVETSVRGTAVGTRTGSGPFVRWTDVHLQDPTVTAAGYGVVAGRCDHSHRVRLAAGLRQTWSNDGRGADSRRSDEGPAAAALHQFDTGAPIRLPERTFPASGFDPGYRITGEISVDARSSTGSESFTYPVGFALDVGPR